ncbi:hypothetical protein TRIUR3_15972 [Triticum urartu]|uniref:Uncharacterized protein n=1 Tax=Triticum urartu TaxID=4572 RepID=M7ZXB1_TRIUA|nr:hypothetical protein TRIUR3_15972 [Triticum urartu]
MAISTPTIFHHTDNETLQQQRLQEGRSDANAYAHRPEHQSSTAAQHHVGTTQTAKVYTGPFKLHLIFPLVNPSSHIQMPSFHVQRLPHQPQPWSYYGVRQQHHPARLCPDHGSRVVPISRLAGTARSLAMKMYGVIGTPTEILHPLIGALIVPLTIHVKDRQQIWSRCQIHGHCHRPS